MAENRHFSSRWALIFAMLSMAVGTGNIWRFPRVVAQNDGGTFLVPWVIFLIVWSTPLILTEFALGRGMRAGPIGAFVRLVGQRFAWMGAWVTLTAVAIMFYYSVVTGWTLRYFFAAVTGELADADHQQFFDDFVASPQPLVLHAVVMVGALVVIYRGVGAIERVCNVLLPTLTVLVVVLAIRAATLPDASKGLAFMFTIDWQNLFSRTSYQIWLEALTQNAWDTGAGWGLVTTYAIYMRKSDDSSVNGLFVGLGNNLISVVAGIAVLCTVFSIDPQAESQIMKSNSGLAFVWIPQLFNKMPLGSLFMILFFAALFFAAWISLISMVELTARALEDLGLPRRRGVAIAGVIALVGGIPSALSIDFLNNQDNVWGTGLILSGLFFAVIVIKYGLAKYRDQLVNVPSNDVRIGRWWEMFMGVLVPVQAVALLIWFFWQTFPGEGALGDRLKSWLDPISVSSAGTIAAQWIVVLALVCALNGWMARHVAPRSPAQDE